MRDIFGAVTNVNRFLLLLAAVRFDNPVDRNEWKLSDPAAAITSIFQKLFNQCQDLYNPEKNLCIDEMLVGFRGRCPFRMYIPNKPDKYGLKIMCLADTRNHYLYNAYIYAGKDTDGLSLPRREQNLPKPTQAFRLSRPMWNTNRNITADNWFDCIPLAEGLKERGMTYVGTLEENKREIPKEYLPNKSRVPDSFVYGFTKVLTLLPLS